VRKQYQNEEIDTSRTAVPDTVSVALGELAGELREGLLALAVGTGLQVMAALMEADASHPAVLRTDSATRGHATPGCWSS
jgi:putative transposase